MITLGLSSAPALEPLKTRHDKLLDLYSRILIQVEGTGFSMPTLNHVPTVAPMGSRSAWARIPWVVIGLMRFMAVGPLTRPFIESHIEHRLGELERIYVSPRARQRW